MHASWKAQIVRLFTLSRPQSGLYGGTEAAIIQENNQNLFQFDPVEQTLEKEMKIQWASLLGGVVFCEPVIENER